MPARGEPWTQEEEQAVRRLHSEGLSLRGIAKELDRPLSTVQMSTARQGLTFDRSQTRAATAAKQADNRARRAALEALMLENAEHFARQARQSIVYTDHGGADFHRVDWEQDEPSPTDKLKLMQAAGVGIDRSMKIAEFDGNNGQAEGKSLISGLVDSLRDVVRGDQK